MIKFNEAELISVLPYYIRSDVDVQAISYAYRMGMDRLLSFARISMLYGDIEVLPEDILDLLALELQSQYYTENMDVLVKRNIIRNSLAWYAKGGTVSAVNEMIQTVFGEGKVIEWFEYGGTPGTFYIETSTELSPEIIHQFNEIIGKVKNKKSYLTNVQVTRKINENVNMAMIARWTSHIIIEGREKDV